MKQKAEHIRFYREQYENAKKVLNFSNYHDTLGVYEMNLMHKKNLYKVLCELNREMDELVNKYADIMAVELGFLD